MNRKKLKAIQDKILLNGLVLIMGYMWFDLAHKIESGRPFKLNNSYYQAHKVNHE